MELRFLIEAALLLAYVRSSSCQCSGTAELLEAVDDYQTFTSPNYPSNYGDNQRCEWRIQADNVTDAIRLEITDASIEYHADCVYDYGQVFDGYNGSSDSLGKFCGTKTPDYVSSGSYIMVMFISDYSLSSRGFKARYKSGPRHTLVDSEPTDSGQNMVLILGATVGGLVFFLVVMVIAITYIQAKKAKETRRNLRMRRGHSTSRVLPYDHGGGVWSIFNATPPPAYGEIYSSPMSPPPAYHEQDPNPDPVAPLPGRPQFMDDSRFGRQVTRVIQVHNVAGRTSPGNQTTNVQVNSSQTTSQNSSGNSARSSVFQRQQQDTGHAQTSEQRSRSRRGADVNNSNLPVPTSGINPVQATVAGGNVAPLATQSNVRGVTVLQRSSQINTNTVVSRNTSEQSENDGPEVNENPESALQRERSYYSISEVSLPDSTNSLEIDSEDSGVE